MSDGGAPPRPDVTSTLGRFALGAVGLVIGAALLFGIVGALNGDGGEAADGASGEAVFSPTPPADAGSPAPTGTGEDPTSPAPADTGSPASPSPTDTASPEQPSGIDPADVSVQVLDAVGDDGSAAASVADRIETAGYDLVAENRAARNYDVTTVFYTDGNEEAARQVAAEFGFLEVAPQPGNLSTAVAVHVVVGQDAA